MFKTILVPLNGVSKDEIVLGAGLAVGRLFDSHLECIRVRLRSAALIWEGELVDVAAGVLTGDLLRTLEAQAQERSNRARTTFEFFCNRSKTPIVDAPPAPSGVSAAWREVTGSQIDEFIANARAHDLTVIERNILRETDPSGDLAGNMVMRCGRPVLLVHDPVPYDFSKTIAIAWKDTPEAARAVAAAMPMLAKAQKIVVLTAEEENSQDAARSADRLAEALRWHGFDVATKTIGLGGQRPAHAIAAGARETGAGLIVMGAYGHHRASELVFGGFTQDVLDGFPLPVLLSH